MSKFKLAIYLIVINIFFICNCAHSQTSYESESDFDFRGQITKYKEKLNKEPSNCFYYGQIASSYQALNEFHNAIDYYQRALAKCPEDLFNMFQLGVSHYLIMERNKGIGYMDSAIDGAAKKGNISLSDMLKGEKKAWLENWDKIQELNWNKK